MVIDAITTYPSFPFAVWYFRRSLSSEKEIDAVKRMKIRHVPSKGLHKITYHTQDQSFSRFKHFKVNEKQYEDLQ